MSRTSRFLAALAVAVLILTASLLGYLRQRAISDIELGTQGALASFQPERLLYGKMQIHFDAAEAVTSAVLQNAYIRRVVLTKANPGHDPAEIPIVPYRLAAQNPQGWLNSLQGMRREPLFDPNASVSDPWGYLYLDVDRSVITSVNWAIGAIGVAIALVLIVLLARLLTQETSLARTSIELNERRRELIRVERLALAGQLAAGLLHDLRKPVLHVQHATDDLSEALGDFAGAAPALHDLKRHTRLFFQMLADSQFERFVQSDRATEEYVSIIPAVEQSLGLVRYERRGAEVLIKDLPNLPPVLAHPYRLIQLFSNIILNAYQAMAGQGKLVIETTIEHVRERNGLRNGILVSFTDSGAGIADESLPHIFEPFFTTKPDGQGTGLGLSICKLIVEDLNGRIDVDSAPGATQFRIWLPAAADAPETAPPDLESCEPNPKAAQDTNDWG